MVLLVARSSSARSTIKAPNRRNISIYSDSRQERSSTSGPVDRPPHRPPRQSSRPVEISGRLLVRIAVFCYLDAGCSFRATSSTALPSGCKCLVGSLVFVLRKIDQRSWSFFKIQSSRTQAFFPKFFALRGVWLHWPLARANRPRGKLALLYFCLSRLLEALFARHSAILVVHLVLSRLSSRRRRLDNVVLLARLLCSAYRRGRLVFEHVGIGFRLASYLPVTF